MFYLSLIFSVIPILIYLIILWWFDKYDREPIKFLLFHFLWGMIGAVILSLVLSSIINKHLINEIASGETANFLATVLTAPLVEETFKGIILIFTIRKRIFDNLTDGIVYGGAIGLGFGMTENFLYFFFGTSNLEELLFLALIRNLFSVSTHFIATATFGVFVALSKFKNFNLKIVLIPTGYFIAVGIHLIWNFMVSFSLTFLIGILFLVITLLIMFVLIQFSLSFEKNVLFYEMNDEIQNGNLNHKFASMISDYKLRNSKGWIDEKYRKEYIKLATKLAFRKNQLKSISDLRLRNIYEVEINELRYKLNQLELASEPMMVSE